MKRIFIDLVSDEEIPVSVQVETPPSEIQDKIPREMDFLKFKQLKAAYETIVNYDRERLTAVYTTKHPIPEKHKKTQRRSRKHDIAPKTTTWFVLSHLPTDSYLTFYAEDESSTAKNVIRRPLYKIYARTIAAPAKQLYALKMKNISSNRSVCWDTFDLLEYKTTYICQVIDDQIVIVGAERNEQDQLLFDAMSSIVANKDGDQVVVTRPPSPKRLRFEPQDFAPQW